MVIALLAGGALIDGASTRELLAATGAWEILLALVAAALLRGHWRGRPASSRRRRVRRAGAGAADGVADP